MSVNHLRHQGDALARGDIREAHQAGVLEAPDVHQFSEIGVDRDQNSAFGSGSFEQRLIARVRSELAGLEDVMPIGAEPVGELWSS